MWNKGLPESNLPRTNPKIVYIVLYYISVFAAWPLLPRMLTETSCQILFAT